MDDKELDVKTPENLCQCGRGRDTDGDGDCAACAHEAEPPQVAEEAVETPENPNLLGELESGEMGLLMSLQQQGRAVILRVGELEVEKTRVLAQLASLEQQNQHHLQAIGKRLSIPQGVQWQVTQDGKVIKVNPPTPFRPQVVPAPK